MRCFICGNLFYIKRGLLELFNTKKEFICDRCYKKYPISLGTEKIYLENYECLVISMFDISYRINYHAYINEYSKIFNSYYNMEEYHVIFIDYLYISDYRLEILDAISKLVEKNLIIITFTLRN